MKRNLSTLLALLMLSVVGGLSVLTAGAQETATLAYDGFESGGWTGGTGWSGVWSVVGAQVFTHLTYPYAGTYYASMRTTLGGDGVTPQYRSITRTVDLSAALSPSLSFWWAPRNTEDANDFLYVEFDKGDGAFALLDTLTIPARTGHLYALAEYSLPGPMEGTAQRIRIATDLYTADSDFVFVDEVLITAIPEPGTLALLGLAGLAILKRRRLL